MIEATQVVIREAKEGDLPALEWEGRYQHYRRLYRQAMTQAQAGRRILLLAEYEDQIIGQIFVQLVSGRAEFADGIESAYLYAFRVRPEFRSHGVGSALLAAAESDLIRRGYRRAVIAVAKTNDRALRLYESHGYRRIGQDPGKWSYVDHEGKIRNVSEPAHILEKALTLSK